MGIMRDDMMQMYFKGYSLIPLQYNSKKPHINWRPYIDRVPSYDEYKRWADAGLFATGYGIVTGKVSGISVLDVDIKSGGLDSLAEHDVSILDEYTWVVDTPNGRHYYYQYDARAKQGQARFGKGVDIRNDGGFVVGPGSRVGDQEYKWAYEMNPTHLEKPSPAPEWLLQATGNRVDKELVTFEDIIRDGQRNKMLSSLAGKLYAARLPSGVVYGAMEYINRNYTETPVEEDELQYIWKSIGRYHDNK